jgi:hypothetical protein
MAQPRVPHPGNAPGDFFIEDNCCTRCDVIFEVAPDLFGVHEADSHCVVKRQPRTPEELERMYDAIRVAELDCIHYKGSDREIVVQVHHAGIGQRKVPAAAVASAPQGWWRRLLRRLGH